MPILSNIGYTVDWKQVTVITWGGLRGAVGLALALVVAQTPGIPRSISSKASLISSSSSSFSPSVFSRSVEHRTTYRTSSCMHGVHYYGKYAYV